MKQLVYVILGFIVGAVLTYYFCPRTCSQIMPMDTKIVKPKGVITPKQAQELSDNWTEYREAVVDSAAKKQGRKEDDRSTYWTLEDIENYLAFAKKQSDSLGYTMTGIRVYLGVYGDNADASKKNLSTMFIVPTGKKLTSKASTINFGFVGGDIPGGGPLNDGAGGPNGYPN